MPPQVSDRPRATRPPVPLLALATCVVALVAALYLLWGQQLAVARVGPALPVRPNFVVIQTDDSTLEQLYAAWRPSPARRRSGRCRTRWT